MAVGALACTQEQGAEWLSRLGFGDTAAIMCLAEDLIGAGSKMLARIRNLSAPSASCPLQALAASPGRVPGSF